MATKENCWEYLKCGRESGGENAKKLGVCPVTEKKKLDGVHGGKNGGRSCWVIAGTLCKGEVQGTFATKYRSCEKCEFFHRVRSEEGADFKFGVSLLQFLYK